MYKLYLISLITTVVIATELTDYHQPHKKPIIPILKQTFDQHHEGWQFSYETGNGIHAEETGFIKNKGSKDHEILVQQGTVTYHDEHGHPITLTYVADEHGFRAQGAHLPTPPPVPAEIQKNLHVVPPQEEVYGQQETGQEHYAPEDDYQ